MSRSSTVGILRKRCFASSSVAAAVSIGEAHILPGKYRSPESDSYVRAISECQDRSSLQDVQAQISKSGLAHDLFLSSCIVHAYLRCGCTREAWSLFSQLHETDVITWTRLIATFAQKGHFAAALQIFREMQHQGVPPDGVTFITLLNSCAKFCAAREGKQIHRWLLETGIELSNRVGNSLIDFYAKCELLEDAQMAFDNLDNPDLVSWNTLIAAQASCSCSSELKHTLKIFQRMQHQGMKPDAFTLVTLLNACSDHHEPTTIATVKHIHSRICELGLSTETVVCNALMNTYGKAGLLDLAMQIFDTCCLIKDPISWNVIISGCVQRGHTAEALRLYRRMQLEGVPANQVAFLTTMNACSTEADLIHARLIHTNVVEAGCSNQTQLGNALIGMYGRCCSVDDARATFEAMPSKDVVSWNSLMAAYAVNGYCDYALELYHWMQLEGWLPTNITFATALNACNEQSLDRGRLIHANLAECGYQDADIIACALVDMYCKSGSLEDAHQIFAEHRRKSSVVLWTAIIGGYSEAGYSEQALQLFKRMQLEGVKPNKVTFVTVLNACANMSSLLGAAEGKSIHSQIVETGYASDLAVNNALLNLLGKSGSLELIEKIFSEMEQWDVIAGTVMISAYSQQGLWKKSLHSYHRLLLEGLRPNPTTFVAVLTSCANLATAAAGKPIHASILETGCASVPVVQSSLVNFYGKCGNLKLARKLFEDMEDKRMVAYWTAIMAGYAQHGHMDEARKIFRRMQQEGVKPDRITFISVLSVCSHAGLVEDACHFFVAMTKDLDIPATIEHYGCMIDLLGRTGWLHEAEGLVKRMTVQPDAVLWTSLLGSSRVHGNLKLAEHAAQHAIELDPENAATYVQLSNAYAVAKPSEVVCGTC